MNDKKEEDLVSNRLPENARRILVDAAERAKQFPEGSKERTLEIEYAVETVRNNWPEYFK